jgi:hypothetical protein
MSCQNCDLLQLKLDEALRDRDAALRVLEAYAERKRDDSPRGRKPRVIPTRPEYEHAKMAAEMVRVNKKNGPPVRESATVEEI